MLWVIAGIVVVGAVFVVGTLLGSAVSRSIAGDRARSARRDRALAVPTPTPTATPTATPAPASGPAAFVPEPREGRTRPRVHLTRTLLDG